MSKQLTPRQKIAIELLAHGASRTEVAEKIGCDAKTVQRWQKLPVFCEALQVESCAVVKETARQMKALQSKALEKLALLMDYGSERTQLQASLRFLADIAQSRQDHALEIQRNLMTDADYVSQIGAPIQTQNL